LEEVHEVVVGFREGLDRGSRHKRGHRDAGNNEKRESARFGHLRYSS
jgi:hypothetical protein